ncbi:MAG: phenyltransferase domain-containing protein [Deltaproteobacteria bacterium]|nr:MAG: phenyltransferase domain-containing protein [Deltaproteobacteria bacterium]
MEINLSRSKQDSSLEIDSIVELIASTQRKSGEIPWCEGQKTDPWDHIEAAMGLSIGGYFTRARQAFYWAAQKQNSDGSWFASYNRGVPEDKTRDANLSSYIAVGVYHYYLITGDLNFLKDMWPAVYAAINFALSLQRPEGEIYWAISPKGKVDPMALLTGCSSICMSIKSALAIAKHLGYTLPKWARGLKKLENAIVNKPHRFNMTKSRFSMDWFYPILCGAVTGDDARRRIDKYWKKYVIEGQGVRCVYDEPWITIAETSELSMTLAAMGNYTLAEIVYHWMDDKKFEDGTCWCGFTFPDMTLWPEDKITWTNAVVLMAADALYGLTPAAQLFSHQFWSSSNFSCY